MFGYFTDSHNINSLAPCSQTAHTIQLFLQRTKPEGEVLGDLMVMSGVKVSPRPFFVSGPKKLW